MTLCLGEQLYGRIKAEAQLESRHLQDQVIYLVEVMLAVAKRQLMFRLVPEHLERSEPCLGIKLLLEERLEDDLFHLGCSYGLSKQQIIRTLLWMGLDCRKQAGHNNLVLSKEDLVELSLEQFRAPARIH